MLQCSKIWPIMLNIMLKNKNSAQHIILIIYKFALLIDNFKKAVILQCIMDLPHVLHLMTVLVEYINRFATCASNNNNTCTPSALSWNDYYYYSYIVLAMAM